MLYKYLFNILCGHLNLNKKRKKFEFDRLPVKPAGIPVRTVSTGEFEFKFAFVRFRPVTGLTGPVSRNRTPAVRGDRSENLTLISTPSFHEFLFGFVRASPRMPKKTLPIVSFGYKTEK